MHTLHSYGKLGTTLSCTEIKKACFMSKSVFDIRIRYYLYGYGSGSRSYSIFCSMVLFPKSRVSDPDPHGSGSRRATMTHKNRKKSRIFIFLSTGCSLLKAEGFSCSLGVLYGGLGISKLQFLIKKIEIKFPSINFFPF